MAGDNHGDKTKEEPRAQEDFGQQQAMQEQPQVRGKDWEKAVRMLIRENLIRGAELEICAVEMVPEPERTVLSGVPVPSR